MVGVKFILELTASNFIDRNCRSKSWIKQKLNGVKETKCLTVAIDIR